MRNDGFTLIEVLTACALLTAALGTIWTVWLRAGDTADLLGRKVTSTDASIQAIAIITRELRAASLAQLSPLPADEVTYRIPDDLDGNGLPVDSQGAPEWGAVRRIGRDLMDVNGDGFSDTQLVLEHDGQTMVLANGLLTPDTAARGIWFEAVEGGVQVSIAVTGTTRRKHVVVSHAVQFIAPRNP